MQVIEDLPKGFSAGAAQAAFKKAGRDDLGLIYSDRPCVLAAMFTRNLFASAPVQIDRRILANGGEVRAIVANSGQANSCTGPQGLENCHEIQGMAARALGVEPDQVLLLSTGVIGVQFDMDKWRRAFPELISSLGSRDAEGFTRAFMTTDAFPKFASAEIELTEGTVRLTVMAKGAGMICPNMATMLCVVLTDAEVERTAWQKMFQTSVDLTFNRVSVDGDTSTNDTILGLANGASGVSLSSAADEAALQTKLTEILGRVAKMLVRDGEGAKRVIHITVRGTPDRKAAETAARAVGNSQLVKTAIYGGDANWGRIVNAVGYSGVRIDPLDVKLSLAGIERFRNGQPVNNELEDELAKRLQKDEVEVELILGAGPGEFDLWTSDLGHEYVSLNSDYRS